MGEHAGDLCHCGCYRMEHVNDRGEPSYCHGYDETCTCGGFRLFATSAEVNGTGYGGHLDTPGVENGVEAASFSQEGV